MRQTLRGTGRIVGLAVVAAAVSLAVPYAGRAEAPGTTTPIQLAQATPPTDPAAKPGAAFSPE